MAAEIVVLYEIIDTIDEELPLDEEDGEFHLISGTAAFMKRDLKRIAGFCEVVVPSYAIDEFRSHFRMTKTTFEVLAQELAASVHSKQNSQLQPCWCIPRDADKNWRMAWNWFRMTNGSTFSVRIFRVGILDYLSRRSVYFRKFPFGQTKTVLAITSQPEFPEFFGKWY